MGPLTWQSITNSAKSRAYLCKGATSMLTLAQFCRAIDRREKKQNTERWITLINCYCLFSLKKYQCVLRCAPFLLLFTRFPFPSTAPLLIARGDQSLLGRKMWIFQVMGESQVPYHLCRPELGPAPHIHNLSSSRPLRTQHHKPGPPVRLRLIFFSYSCIEENVHVCIAILLIWDKKNYLERWDWERNLHWGCTF